MSNYLKDVCRNGKAYVLDAAGFFASVQSSLAGKVYTVPGVIDEVRDLESKRMLAFSVSADKVVVIKPDKKYRSRVITIARNLGEEGKLSETDIELLSLLNQLLSMGCKEVYLVSDDKSVQNVALTLGAKVLGIKYKALRKSRKYIYACPMCGYVSNKPGICPKCGLELVRKRIR